MARLKLKGRELQAAKQAAHLRRMEMCAWGAYNDYDICPDCAQILDPSAKCSCVEVSYEI